MEDPEFEANLGYTEKFCLVNIFYKTTHKGNLFLSEKRQNIVETLILYPACSFPSSLSSQSLPHPSPLFPPSSRPPFFFRKGQVTHGYQ